MKYDDYRYTTDTFIELRRFFLSFDFSGLLFWRAWLIVSSVGCVVEQLSLFIWILGRFLLDFGGISV